MNVISVRGHDNDEPFFCRMLCMHWPMLRARQDDSHSLSAGVTMSGFLLLKTTLWR